MTIVIFHRTVGLENKRRERRRKAVLGQDEK